MSNDNMNDQVTDIEIETDTEELALPATLTQACSLGCMLISAL